MAASQPWGIVQTNVASYAYVESGDPNQAGASERDLYFAGGFAFHRPANFTGVQDEVHRRYPFFQSNLLEQKKLFERGREL